MAVAGLVVLVAAPGARAQEAPIADGAPIMPLEQVEVGMHGVGYTVIRGTVPERFEAEIIGVLHDAFPKQDLIVARLSGLGLERSRVAAGMSGSPVLIDGRVIGAVAYSLVNFGQDPVAGIVPIESMLAVAAMESDHGPGTTHAPGAAESVLRAAAAYLTGTVPPGGLAFSRPVASLAGLHPLATPMTLSGFHPEIVAKLTPLFEGLGWSPMVGGTAGRSRSVAPNLVPGGAVAVQLMRGDINVTATGTVTYRDGDRLLAFGHPFLQGGDVDFPMVAAEIITILNSAANSSKLSTAGTDILGSFRQDRLAAIMGVVGARPRLIPVSVDIEGIGAANQELHFELVADKVLTPLYLFLGLVNGVQSLDAVYGAEAIEVEASFHLDDHVQAVNFGNLFSSHNQAIIGLSSSLMSVFAFLYDNAFEPVEIRDVEVAIKLRDDRKTAAVSRVWYDRSEVRPGETVQVMVALQPYRGSEIIERIEVPIPAGLAPGPLTLMVGDGNAVTQEEASFMGGGVRPRSVEQLVGLLNQLRRSDRLYVQVSRPDEGALLGGEVLPQLPPSMMSVLSSKQSRGDFVRLRRSVIMETSQPVDYVVSGSHKIQLTVRER